jgi:hypothetical protein
MKKRLIVVAIILFGYISIVNAQAPTHVPLMTNVWKLIAQKTYVKNANYKMVPSFPKPLKALQNKMVELPGYIIPTKADYEFQEFMLAVVPYDQCPYCGQGDIPSMIEVKSLKPIKHSDKPVKIKGKLLLNETGDSRSEIFLLDAIMVN